MAKEARKKSKEAAIRVGKRDPVFAVSLTDSTVLYCCKCHYFVFECNLLGRRHAWAVPHDLPCPEGLDHDEPLPDPARLQWKREREDEDAMAAKAELAAARKAAKQERVQEVVAENAVLSKAMANQEDRNAFFAMPHEDQAERLATLREAEERERGQRRRVKKLRKSVMMMRRELKAAGSPRRKAQRETRRLRKAMKRVEQELINAEVYGREVNEKLLRELEVSSRLLTHVYCVAHLGWLETLTGSSPKQYQKIEEVKQNDYLRNSLGPLPTASGKTNARKAPDPRDIVMSYFARFRHNLSREWVAKVSGLSRNVFTKNLFICGLLPGGQVRELPAAGRRDLGQRRQDQGSRWSQVWDRHRRHPHLHQHTRQPWSR